MINERLMQLGQFTVKLKTDTPADIRSAIAVGGHLVATDAPTDPRKLGDAGMLSLARYAGILLGYDYETLDGQGVEWHLGDADDRGDVHETAVVLTSSTFQAAIAALLPPNGAVTAGTISAIAGLYTATHQWETPRHAIRYVCDVFGGEYRVNPDGTLDAGLATALYSAAPTAIIVGEEEAHHDPLLDGLPGTVSAERDLRGIATRAVVVAEGSGTTAAIGSANSASNTLRDLHGNLLARTMLFSEPETTEVNSDARAAIALSAHDGSKQRIKLSLLDYEVEGRFVVGDWVWVYAPALGLVDEANTVRYGGRQIHPVKIRVVGYTWPPRPGQGFYYRPSLAAVTGADYIDLTNYIDFSEATSEGHIEIGDPAVALLSEEDQALAAARLNTEAITDDGIAPAIPAATGTPWPTFVYQDANGLAKSRVVPSWATPLDGDAGVVVDGSHYEIRYRITGVSSYQFTSVAWGTNTVTIHGLEPGVSYDIGVQAVDIFANASGYGADQVVVMVGDTIAPSTPAAPTTITGSALRVQVIHDLGKSTGGTFNLEADLDHLNVYAGTVTGFTPSSANKLGSIPATHANLQLAISAIGDFALADTVPRFIKVTAVDASGNESPASASAGVTGQLIDTAYIADLAVTSAKVASLSATKITAGTIGAHTIVMDGITSILQSSNYVADTSGWQILGNGNTELNDVAIRGVVNGNLTLTSTGTLRTAATGGRIELTSIGNGEMRFYSGGVNEAASSYIKFVNSSGDPLLYVVGPLSTGITVPSKIFFFGDGQVWLDTGGPSALAQADFTVRVRSVRFTENGTAASPMVTWSNDSDTGLFHPSTAGLPNTLAISVGGVERVRFTTTQVFIPSGTFAAPGLAFWSDNGTGVYSVGASRLGFSIGGVHVAEFNAGKLRTANAATGSPEIRLGSSTGSAALPVYTFQGDDDSGYYWVSDGITAVSGNGQISMVFDAPNSDIRPGVDNIYNLGNASFRFVDVWAVDTTINSSDRREKTAITKIKFDAQQMVRDVPAVQFRRKRHKRVHTGWIAQDVAAWLDERGIDYAMLIDPERAGEEGKMGLRVGELTAVLWEACRAYDRRLTALEASLAGTRPS